ncbi:hypothetical protein ADUPG1_009696, partial [Aduncisulcus paluster]
MSFDRQGYYYSQMNGYSVPTNPRYPSHSHSSQFPSQSGFSVPAITSRTPIYPIQYPHPVETGHIHIQSSEHSSSRQVYSSGLHGQHERLQKRPQQPKQFDKDVYTTYTKHPTFPTPCSYPLLPTTILTLNERESHSILISFPGLSKVLSPRELLRILHGRRSTLFNRCSALSPIFPSNLFCADDQLRYQRYFTGKGSDSFFPADLCSEMPSFPLPSLPIGECTIKYQSENNNPFVSPSSFVCCKCGGAGLPPYAISHLITNFIADDILIICFNDVSVAQTAYFWLYCHFNNGCLRFPDVPSLQRSLSASDSSIFPDTKKRISLVPIASSEPQVYYCIPTPALDSSKANTAHFPLESSSGIVPCTDSGRVIFRKQTSSCRDGFSLSNSGRIVLFNVSTSLDRSLVTMLMSKYSILGIRETGRKKGSRSTFIEFRDKRDAATAVIEMLHEDSSQIRRILPYVSGLDFGRPGGKVSRCVFNVPCMMPSVGPFYDEFYRLIDDSSPRSCRRSLGSELSEDELILEEDDPLGFYYSDTTARLKAAYDISSEGVIRKRKRHINLLRYPRYANQLRLDPLCQVFYPMHMQWINREGLWNGYKMFKKKTISSSHSTSTLAQGESLSSDPKLSIPSISSFKKEERKEAVCDDLEQGYSTSQQQVSQQQPSQSPKIAQKGSKPPRGGLASMLDEIEDESSDDHASIERQSKIERERKDFQDLVAKNDCI